MPPFPNHPRWAAMSRMTPKVRPKGKGRRGYSRGGGGGLEEEEASDFFPGSRRLFTSDTDRPISRAKRVRARSKGYTTVRAAAAARPLHATTRIALKNEVDTYIASCKASQHTVIFILCKKGKEKKWLKYSPRSYICGQQHGEALPKFAEFVQGVYKNRPKRFPQGHVQ